MTTQKNVIFQQKNIRLEYDVFHKVHDIMKNDFVKTIISFDWVKGLFLKVVKGNSISECTDIESFFTFSSNWWITAYGENNQESSNDDSFFYSKNPRENTTFQPYSCFLTQNLTILASAAWKICGFIIQMKNPCQVTPWNKIWRCWVIFMTCWLGDSEVQVSVHRALIYVILLK